MVGLLRGAVNGRNFSEIDLLNCPVSQSGRLSIFWLHDVPIVLDRVLGAMKQTGYGAADQVAVQRALEEATVNALKHGHGHDPRKQVRIWWTVTAASVRLVVEDEGRGFDPACVTDRFPAEDLEESGGRGLFLIFAHMSWVRFNCRGNCVVMYRHRSQEVQASLGN
jgi:anti-sigma regulatory factor (Ser/Thr protein kinase)